MRKKYLSALLFGALLFASAGTFTSCKDYDDDINNLQEQINTVKTSLDELSEKINSLGAGVTDFKYEGGKLILSTDKGTNFEVTLPEDKVGITKVEVKDGYLWIDGVKGDAIATEGEAIDVRVDENGILYINNEPQDLKDEVGSKVIMVDNNNGTYTLTVDGASYVLPKASAAVSLISTDQVYFTNLSQSLKTTDAQTAAGAIVWGTADSYRGNWGGKKAVEKGKLLVGQISTVQVRVAPATFDLETAKLTLVNTLGEEAPVNVVPVAQGKKGPAISDSRAADANGVWDLKIEMKSSVTANNIGTIFAAKDADYVYQNVKYALAVDGKVATDYMYYVDTDKTKAGSTAKFVFDSSNGNVTTSLNFKENGGEKEVLKLSNYSKNTTIVNAIPLGETTLYLQGINEQPHIDRVYDSYLEIKDQDLADKHGITVDGMTITASDKAAALVGFPIIVHVLDIHGNETKVEVNVNFATSKQVGQELGDQTYTLMPSADANKQFILVDLKDVFTSLTADEAVAVSTAGEGTVTWFTTTNKTDNKLFVTTGDAVDGLKKINDNNKVLFYETKEDALAYGLKYDEDVAIKFIGNTADIEASTIRKIAYAVIPFKSIKKEALPDASTPLTVVLKDKDGNEIRKAAGTYTVTLPAFDEVLVANNNKVWKENTFYTRVTATDVEDGKITIEKPFKSKFAENQIGYLDLNEADNRLSYELKYTDFAKKDQYIDIAAGPVAKTAALKGDIVSDDKYKLVNDIDVVATFDVLGTGYDNFKVTKEFKVYLQSVFEGASLSYYKDSEDVLKDGGVMTLGDYQYVYGGQVKGNKKFGLFMNFDGEAQPYEFTTVSGNNIIFTTGYQVGTTYVEVAKPQDSDFKGAKLNKNALAYIYANDGASGTLKAVKDITPVNEGYGDTKRSALEVKLADQNSGELIFTFVDKMGVKVDATLNYQKNAPKTAE
ncbi:hypothetical protein I6E18_13655 [Phocaeicola barnesiae]|uniref:DUF4988 domain-containing protein n=1 Tax=Phocaeicola barnesiae TaxID=376804 RepID=UPI001F2947F0|nr:DUF4988 domain-containing protein [Phocaeicola barnesiae]MCF2577180.1 hypothetical protein [Phocaeicola barnesiae]